MEVTPISFKLRSKSHSTERTAQGQEHKETEVIGCYVRTVCHSSRKKLLNCADSFETDPLGSVSRKQYTQVCDNKQSPTEEDVGSVCRGDGGAALLELLGARDLGYLYPPTCHSLAKCCSWGT